MNYENLKVDVGIKDFRYPIYVLASDFFQNKLDNYLYPLLFVLAGVENTKWILCSRKMVLNGAHLRFTIHISILIINPNIC